MAGQKLDLIESRVEKKPKNGTKNAEPKWRFRGEACFPCKKSSERKERSNTRTP